MGTLRAESSFKWLFKLILKGLLWQDMANLAVFNSHWEYKTRHFSSSSLRNVQLSRVQPSVLRWLWTDFFIYVSGLFFLLFLLFLLATVFSSGGREKTGRLENATCALHIAVTCKCCSTHLHFGLHQVKKWTNKIPSQKHLHI